MKMKYKCYNYYLIALAVIILDQVTKMLVHFNMEMGLLGQIKILGDWFKLYYTVNPGMAFGLKLGISHGKLLLTSFRLIAVLGIAYYVYAMWRNGSAHLFLICLGVILGGAIGNVIDSTFYGVLIGNAPYDASSPWLHGQVIDMFYIDIWEGRVANWVPLIGGYYMSLWPIFNVADASIFIGVTIILVFQKKFNQNT